MKLCSPAIGLLVGISAPLMAQTDSPAAPRLVSVKKIWHGENHSAFTDLVRFDGKWFCTFREAEGHVGGNGIMRVLASNDGERWESSA